MRETLAQMVYQVGLMHMEMGVSRVNLHLHHDRRWWLHEHCCQKAMDNVIAWYLLRLGEMGLTNVSHQQRLEISGPFSLGGLV